MKKQKAISYMKRICITFAIIGVLCLCIGFYKRVSYNNPENEYTLNGEYINSYVGGDAYNYIINGTYFTAYVVMGMGSLIISTICGVTGLYLSIEQECQENSYEKLPDL